MTIGNLGKLMTNNRPYVANAQASLPGEVGFNISLVHLLRNAHQFYLLNPSSIS